MSSRLARFLPSLFARSRRKAEQPGSRCLRNVQIALEIDLLEDRILYNAAPIDASMADLSGEGVATVEVTADGVSPEVLDACDAQLDTCGGAVNLAGEGGATVEVTGDGVSPEVAQACDAELEACGGAVNLADTLDGEPAPAPVEDADPQQFNDSHFDIFGYEYHALPVPIGEPTDDPVDESGGSSGSINIDETGDSLVALSDTFLLHSNLGASHTIYLDFDGHTTSGTIWNSSFNDGQDIITPAYDFDGNTASFSDAELQTIQFIWQRVAEDFIPFDVDVTTEAPSTDELTKSGGGDAEWGIRVVIGGSSDDWYKPSIGGVAYRNSFNWSNDTPAFVFENQLGNGNEKYTAEVISHEVGHTLGLSHDGDSTTSYYQGHGSGETSWAPIMGYSDFKSVTQWSIGEYSGANNHEDDLSIITGNNGFGYRADDYGDSTSSASLLGLIGTDVHSDGIIETSSDYDFFSFTTDGGLVDLAIDGVAHGSNLDIMATLYDAVGTVIVSSNPIGYLDASISVSVTAGQYFLSITGVGEGDPATGYSDYASLGQYFISGTIAPSTASTLSIAATDAVHAEGDAGTTAYTFTVSRTGDVSQSATVDYSVVGSGADPADAFDFASGTLPSGMLSFAAGETSKTITIQVAGDMEVEADESFNVVLANPSSSAHLGTAVATGTILADDVPVTASTIAISAADAFKAEGDSGTTAYTFTVSRSGDTSQAATVDYSVVGSGGDPADGADFYGGVLPAGTVSFAAGETSKTITIQVAGDTEVEADESFDVVLANPSGSAQLGTAVATGTIVADDSPTQESVVSIEATDAVHQEGDSGTTAYTFTVSRSGDASQAATVDYSVVGGANVDGADFAGGVLPSGTISFAAGETVKTLTIDVAGDMEVEGDESFSVVLANPSSSVQLGATSGDAMILTDDFAAAAGITVSPTSGLTTDEGGGSASFTIVLDSRPTDDVFIDIVSLNTAEGVVSTSQLVFTQNNWNVAQTVVVTGVDDTIRDGNVDYTVQVAAASSTDTDYNGLDGDDVQLTNKDDERGKPHSGGGGGGGNNGNGKGGGPKKAPSAADSPATTDGSGDTATVEWTDSTDQPRERNRDRGRPSVVGEDAITDPSGNTDTAGWTDSANPPPERNHDRGRPSLVGEDARSQGADRALEAILDTLQRPGPASVDVSVLESLATNWFGDTQEDHE